MTIDNPFITYGYESAEYFCDRQEETHLLTTLLTNGNHVALISPRRMGKTGLLNHCFAQSDIQQKYYTFLIDIYATKNLQDMVFQMGRTIVTLGAGSCGPFPSVCHFAPHGNLV